MDLEKKIKVLLQPLGPATSNVAEEVAFELNGVFRLLEFTPSHMHVAVPHFAFNDERGQYDSSTILEELSRLYDEGLFQGYAKVVGLADVDAYVQGLNFVFGEAILNGQAAAVYLARLRPEFYGAPPDAGLFRERTCKEVVHELGHTFGLRHCAEPTCVMHFSNSIHDTDYKSLALCARCRNLLFRSISLA